MIIEDIHYRVRLKFNKINTNTKKTFNDLELDMVIQSAIDEYIEIFYSGSNPKKYKLGFEVTQQRIDMLSTLVVSQLEQPMLTPASSNADLGLYEFKLSELVHPYRHFLRGNIKVEGCDKLYNLAIEQHDDLNNVLDDHNRIPSTKWLRAIGVMKKDSSTIGNSSIYVYTAGEFIPEGLYIEYLKEAAQVSLGTYTEVPTAENTNPPLKPKVECDLPEVYHSLIVDMTVQELTRILEDTQYPLRQEKIISSAH